MKNYMERAQRDYDRLSFEAYKKDNYDEEKKNKIAKKTAYKVFKWVGSKKQLKIFYKLLIEKSIIKANTSYNKFSNHFKLDPSPDYLPSDKIKLLQEPVFLRHLIDELMESDLILKKQRNRVNKIIVENFIDAEREIIIRLKLAGDYSYYGLKNIYKSNKRLIIDLINMIIEN
jgi:hypothetical protein